MLRLFLGGLALVSALLVSPAFAQTSPSDRNIDTNLQTISTHSDLGSYALLGVLALVIILAVACSFALVQQQRSKWNSRQD